ncbi:MAG: short-chain fatty acyl-CoA regulator family protein [Paracoccaceae bacterium]|nr:short-chain fatty acyl-CoA regulator family protein [Paracoccaceae bacterium]
MPRGALTGSRIRDRRLAAGIRQADLARAAGISASYLNLIEHNRRRIGGKLVADIARALSCEVSTLTEGAEAVLLAALREAAAAGGRGAEEERAEEFAGRFPGWARLLAERHARVERLEREVEALSDRLAHDPQLSASLHELLTAVTAIRSSTSILAGTENLDPAWAARFLGILDAEGRRLAEGAEALARYLDGPGRAEPAAATPQEEVEAFFAARGWHLPELESGAGPEAVDALVAGAAELTSAGGQALARAAACRYAEDARRMPLAEVEARADEGAGAVAASFGVPAQAALRRLALLPGREAGLVIADAAGAITFRRPIAGFSLPRHGAGCPLWPLYQALSRPGVPVAAVVEMPGAGARRFRAEAVAAPLGPADFAAPPVFEATMLLTSAGPEGAAEAVGATCRICPREGCRARREPSILGPAPP